MTDVFDRTASDLLNQAADQLEADYRHLIDRLYDARTVVNRFPPLQREGDRFVYHNFLGSFQWEIPWDMTRWNEIDAAMKERGWRRLMTPRRNPESLEMTTLYFFALSEDKSVVLYLVMQARPGQDNCNIIQVGERRETLVKPIYDILCKGDEHAETDR